MNSKMITKTANRGVGLFTSIGIGFSSIFGCTCRKLKNKQDDLLAECIRAIEIEIKHIKNGYTIKDFRINWINKLNVNISLLVEEEELPKDTASPLYKIAISRLIGESISNLSTFEIEVVAKNLKSFNDEILSTIADGILKYNNKIDAIEYLKSYIAKNDWLNDYLRIV